MQLKVFHLRRSRFAPLSLIIITTFYGFATPVKTPDTRLIGRSALSLKVASHLWEGRKVVILKERSD